MVMPVGHDLRIGVLGQLVAHMGLTKLGCMVDAYIDLFAFMPVPLLYRWKHAPVANNFLRGGVFLHAILPRVLEILPTVKCILA